MGPKPPPKLTKLAPKAMRAAINALRDYALTTHIERVTVRTPVSSDDSPSAQLSVLKDSGTNLLITAGSGGAGSGSTLTPWQISISEVPPNSGQFYASVRPGSVNSLVPWNIFYQFLIVNGANYIKIKCDTDGKTPNLITVQCDTNPVASTALVASNTSPSTFYDTIGVVTQYSAIPAGSSVPVITNTVYQVRSTNLNASPAIDFLESRTAPTPLDEPFIRWYKWSIIE